MLDGATFADRAPDEVSFTFPAPITEILLLDRAAAARRSADRTRRQLRSAIQPCNNGLVDLEIAATHEKRVHDAIADEITAVTFSTMAISSFSIFALNKHADDSYVFNYQGKEYGRKKIESRLPLMEFVTCVLPEIWPSTPEFPETLVAELRELQNLRNAIQHMRGHDRMHAERLKPGVLGALLVGNVCGPAVALDVFEHVEAGFVPGAVAKKVSALDIDGMSRPPQCNRAPRPDGSEASGPAR